MPVPAVNVVVLTCEMEARPQRVSNSSSCIREQGRTKTALIECLDHQQAWYMHFYEVEDITFEPAFSDQMLRF